MAAALALKNAEIEALTSSFDTMKRQASMAEGKLATLLVCYSIILCSTVPAVFESCALQPLKLLVVSSHHL